jgi:hypothetical protein
MQWFQALLTRTLKHSQSVVALMVDSDTDEDASVSRRRRGIVSPWDADEFEGDWFDRNPDWADDLPDLGTESVEMTPAPNEEDEPFETEHLPDIGKESLDNTDE